MADRIGELEYALEAAPGFYAFMLSEAGRAMTDRLKAQAERVKVLSLDVFDTVLLRDSTSELARFDETAFRYLRRNLSIPRSLISPPAAAVLARVHAAADAYQMAPPVRALGPGGVTTWSSEARYADITLQLVRRMGVEDYWWKMATLGWRSAELEVETNRLERSPMMEEVIEHAARHGTKVILVSDMYLEGDTIAGLVEGTGVDMTCIDRVVSSADRGLTKRSGTIFPELAREMGVEPGEMLHAGDNLHSDYRQPMRCGLQVQHLPIPARLRRLRMQSHRETCRRLFETEDAPLPMELPEGPARAPGRVPWIAA